MSKGLYLIYGTDYVMYKTEDDSGFPIIQMGYSTTLGEELIKFLENDEEKTPYQILLDENSVRVREKFRDELRYCFSDEINYYHLDGRKDRQPLPIEILSHANYFKEEYSVKFELGGNPQDGFYTKHVYYVDRLYKALQLEIIKLIGSGTPCKICSNCGKLFIPSMRSSSIIYCDRVFKNGRTCKDVGYERKIESDCRGIYRKWYKNYHAQTRRRKKNILTSSDEKVIDNKFNDWLKAANSLLNEIEVGSIRMTSYEFEESLQSLWGNKRGGNNNG